MIIEMLAELFADSSSIYFYFSFFLSTFGTIKLTQIGLHKFIGNTHVCIRNSHAARIQSAPIHDSTGETTDIMNWIVRKAKRIESPDDDNADDHIFSFIPDYDKKEEDEDGSEICIYLHKKI